MNQSEISPKLKARFLKLLENPLIYKIHIADLKKFIKEFTLFEQGTYEIKIFNRRIDDTILHIRTGKTARKPEK